MQSDPRQAAAAREPGEKSPGIEVALPFELKGRWRFKVASPRAPALEGGRRSRSGTACELAPWAGSARLRAPRADLGARGQAMVSQGTFGAVYAGVDLRTHDKVAVKLEAVSDRRSLLKTEVGWKTFVGLAVCRLLWPSANTPRLGARCNC